MRERERAVCPCVQKFVNTLVCTRRTPLTRLPRTLPSLSDAASDMLSAREHIRLDMPSARFVPWGRNFRGHRSRDPSSVSFGPTDDSRVDILRLRYISVNCGAEKSPGSPHW